MEISLLEDPLLVRVVPGMRGSNYRTLAEVTFRSDRPSILGDQPSFKNNTYFSKPEVKIIRARSGACVVPFEFDVMHGSLETSKVAPTVVCFRALDSIPLVVEVYSRLFVGGPESWPDPEVVHVAPDLFCVVKADPISKQLLSVKVQDDFRTPRFERTLLLEP